MKDSNHYFETPGVRQGELTDDVIVSRMSECNLVLNELAKNKVWQIVISDAKKNIRDLDNCWQELVPDSKQFQEARVLKLALKTISDLPSRYGQEQKALQEELLKRQQPEEIVQKDYDMEISDV